MTSFAEVVLVLIALVVLRAILEPSLNQWRD